MNNTAAQSECHTNTWVVLHHAWCNRGMYLRDWVVGDDDHGIRVRDPQVLDVLVVSQPPLMLPPYFLHPNAAFSS